MNSASRVYFVACAAIIGFVFCYALPIYARLPRAFYDPIARQWHWAKSLGPIPMGYVGQMVWGLGGAAIGMSLAALIVRRASREPSARAFVLWAAWTLTAVVVVAAYFTWNNWP